MPDEPTYYIAVNGQTQGPFPISHIRHWHQNKQLDPATQVHDGMAWLTLDQFMASQPFEGVEADPVKPKTIVDGVEFEEKPDQPLETSEEKAAHAWAHSTTVQAPDSLWETIKLAWQELMAKRKGEKPPEYTPAPGEVTSPDFQNVEAGEEAELTQTIRGGSYAGFFVAGMTAIVAAIALVTGGEVFGVNAWAFVDVVVIGGLSAGFYGRSRVCGSVLLVYFIIGKIYMMIETRQPRGVFLMAFVGYLMFRGVVAAFKYHAMKR